MRAHSRRQPTPTHLAQQGAEGATLSEGGGGSVSGNALFKSPTTIKKETAEKQRLILLLLILRPREKISQKNGYNPEKPLGGG